MTVAVYDSKLKRTFVCCSKKAAEIVGVHYNTILRWSYKNKTADYRHFFLSFDVHRIKQPKGDFNKIKCFVYT